jgi:NAD(P)-dependent dehydrogenase (short-subunit alcohol dehydrogenase family)
MQGKTVVITGATSGIGEVAAVALARAGARIVMVARDAARADATMARFAGQGHTVHLANLSRLSEMKRVAAEIAAGETRIDVLINNAGALFNTREVTEDGLEKTFATNHLAYFVMTALLLPRLKATPGARVVSTASDAHRGAKLDFADLQSSRRYSGFSVYGRSKLMNILFTRELARRLDGSGVTANCLHPGFVATRFGDRSGGITSFAIRMAKPFAGLSPEKGAETIIHLASSPDVANVSGQYFYKCKIATPTAEARDDESAKRLWDETAKIAGLDI